MITIPVDYAYLSLSLIAVAVWLGLLILNKDGRRRQIILSLIFSVAGPIGELFYIPDYWHPPTVLSVHIFSSYVSIEDLIFSFAIMGIMSSLPVIVLRIPRTDIRPLSLNTISIMGAILLVIAILSIALWLVGLNSIFATSLAMLLTAGVILLHAKRLVLLKVSLVGAIGMLLMMFIIYWLGFLLVSDSNEILRAIWSLYGTSLGVRIFMVPLPELVWAFSFGSLFSVLFTQYPVRKLP